ncbi:hypothetical protein BH23GEM4_BH23GEM4_19090 [soil metagenome]
MDDQNEYGVAPSPQRAWHGGALWRAALLGVGLGAVALVAGALLLPLGGRVLAGAAGVVATFAAALGSGIWAGVVPPEDEAPADERLFLRWILAGLAVGVAGVFALLWQIASIRLGAAGPAAGLLFLVALPTYALGAAAPALEVWAGRMLPYDEQASPSSGGAGIAAAIAAGTAAGAVVTALLLSVQIPPGPLLLGTAALLTSPLLRPGSEPERISERTVWEGETAFGALRVSDNVWPGHGQPERRLYVDEEIESGELVRSGTPTFPYIHAAEQWLEETTPTGAAYLFLGGGAYTLPRRIAEHDRRARITVAELDPEITRVASRFFGLRPEHRIRTLHGDARAVLEAVPGGTYDRIFIDVFDGTEAVPYSLRTVEAWRNAAAALAPGGVVAMNVIGVVAGAGVPRLWSTVRTAAEALPAAVLYAHLGPDFPDPQNFILAASPDPLHRFAERAGSFARWEREAWPHPAATTIFRDRFEEQGVANPAPREAAPALARERAPG